MNWSKVKTVLIIMFSLINIFLIIWNISINKEKYVVNEKTIKTAERLLEKRGISVPDGMIEEGIPDIRPVVVKNVMADEAKFLGDVLGSKYEKHENVFANGKRSVKIEGNYFEIEEKISINTADEAKEWLTSLGIDMKNTIKSEEKGKVEFISVYKGKEIFGSKITVVTGEKTAKATGSFFYVIENTEKDADILHVTSVLPKLIQEGISDCSVLSIKTGYRVVTEGEKFSEAGANPTYKILISDGREIFYNATK